MNPHWQRGKLAQGAECGSLLRMSLAIVSVGLQVVGLWSVMESAASC